MAGLAYFLLERALIAAEGESSRVGRAVGSSLKEWLSCLLYIVGGVAAFLVSPWLSIVLYMSVALMWLVPDRRFTHLQ